MFKVKVTIESEAGGKVQFLSVIVFSRGLKPSGSAAMISYMGSAVISCTGLSGLQRPVDK